MRIVYANNFLYIRGGSERVMVAEATWMHDRGHEVYFYGQQHPDAANLPYAELFPPYEDWSEARGFSKVKTAMRTIYNRGTGLRFAAFLQKVQPDIIHAHNIYGGLTTAVLDAAKAANIPVVVTLHDYKLACPSYLMLNHGERCRLCVEGGFYHCLTTRCHKDSYAVSAVSTLGAYFEQWNRKWRQVDRFIAPSNFLAGILHQKGYPADRIVHIPNGLDPAGYEAHFDDLGYGLYLGRLSPEKGLKTLLFAVKQAGYPLKIAGDGPMRYELEEVTASKHAESVELLGHLSGEELKTAVQNAAFVVVPSEWYENCSMTVLEAMAYGKAVIATRLGGLPEQVVNEETGYIVEPGNVQALEEAIKWLYEDKELRLRLGEAARKRFEEKFTLEDHGTRLLDEVYQSMLATS